MKDNNLHNYSTIYFVGIGGIGMSALARLFLHEGKQIRGSDASSSKLVDDLRSEGMEIFIGHKSEHVTSDVDLLIYTAAARSDNPELLRAEELEIPTLSYPEALGLVSRSFKTIAVAGTHGKTTTTAMLAHILKNEEKDPTVIVGSLLKEGNTNFIHGDSDIFVAEACEYKRHFLNLSPFILVITNIEEDHLDYYKDLADIQDAFREFVEKVPDDGYIICNPNDPNVAPVLTQSAAEVIDYTQTETPHLSLPGAHNVQNGKAAMSAAVALGVEKDSHLLEHFTGTWRRGEFKKQLSTAARLYDDYAHHPTEIKATLQGFKTQFPEKKIIAVFQPHLFSRTKLLLDDFSSSFSDADEVVVLPIYAAREIPDTEINAEILVKEIKKQHSNVSFFSSFEEVVSYIKSNTDENTIVITMGAGDVYTISELL